MRAIASIWTWSVFAVACIVGFAVAVVLRALTWPFDRRCAITGRFVRLIGVLTAKLNPLWTFRIQQPLGSYRPSKTVVVSNHVSNSDVFLLAHLPWEMKWLGKSSLFFIPFVGWLMWLAGDVPVKRGAKDSIMQAMEACRIHLERGMPVMIFPEGTRSKSGELLPFKSGAFRLALDSGADILPLAIAGTRSALPKGSWQFGRTVGLVMVGTPISTAGKTVSQAKAEARAQIEQLYATVQAQATPH